MFKHAGFCFGRVPAKWKHFAERVLANWAGWDMYGRLMVAAGRHLHIYEVKPGEPLPERAKILDLEVAI